MYDVDDFSRGRATILVPEPVFRNRNPSGRIRRRADSLTAIQAP
jgi:hypothetical protein